MTSSHGGDAPPAPSAVSVVLHLWLLRPMLRAYKTAPKEDTLPKLHTVFKAEANYQRFPKHFQFSDGDSGKKRRQRSLWQVILFDLSPVSTAVGGTISLCSGLVTTVIRPLALRYVVGRIDEGGERTMLETVKLVFILGAVVLCEGYFVSVAKMALESVLVSHIWSYLTNLLVAKAAISPSSAEHNPANLLGNDVNRLIMNLFVTTQLPGSISGIFAGSIMLVVILGPSPLLGLSISYAIVAFNMHMTKVTRIAEEANLSRADERLDMTKQLLAMIRGVKFFAWEASCLDQISRKRKEECLEIRKFRVLTMLAINTGRMSPMISTLVTILIYAVVLKNPMGPTDIFSALLIFQSMRTSLILIPQGAIAVQNTLLSLHRIETYIHTPVFEKRALLPEPPAAPTGGGDKGSLARLSFSECSLGEKGGERFFSLCDVDLNVQGGSLVAVMGPVGSGKSTLLSALLGALPTKGGAGAKACRKVALVPQKPFILNATVRENVSMGLPFSEELWSRTVAAAQMETDLSLFADGRNTLIGEYGTTLSGGQQMRLTIARALYTEPDLLVMDDPLAALDHVVGSAVLQAVRQLVKTPTIDGRYRAAVVVLNQTHLLSNFDQALWLDGGRVQAQGAPEDVAKRVGLCLLASAHETIDDSCAAADKEKEKPTHAAVAQAEEGKDNMPLAEAHCSGSMKGAVYIAFFRAAGPSLCILCFVAQTFTYLMMAIADRWLAHWVQHGGEDDVTYAILYSLFVLFHIAGMIGASFLFAEAGMRASNALHFDCLLRVLKAPVSWFEDTPSGRIISRFSSDLSMVDLQLAFMVDNLLAMFFAALIMVLVVISVVPLVAVFAFVGSIFFVLQAIMVDRLNKEVKRMRDSAMSPVQTNLSEVLNGEALLQVDANEGRLRDYFLARQFASADGWNRHNFHSYCIMNFALLLTYWLSFLFCLVTTTAIVASEAVPPGLSSLAFVYCFMAPYFLGICSMIGIMVNHCFTSLERLLTLTSPDVPSEAWPEGPDFRAQTVSFGLAHKSWPETGKITFEVVEMRYRPQLPLVLKGVSFEVRGGERLGCIGRTGSGKSTLLVVLFRLVEPCGGRVLVDGIDISKMGLHKLRSSLSMIPQSPILFEGTVRLNLDPFGEFVGKDEALLDALRRAELGSMPLDAEVGAGGDCLSVGERQLLSFARCLLQDRKVVVLDEPTASVDLETDAKLQKLVRSAFCKRTLICIAHRLQTVIDFDRLLVMNAGNIQALDTPQALLQDRQSPLSQIIDSGSGALRAELERILATGVKEMSTSDIQLDGLQFDASSGPLRPPPKKVASVRKTNLQLCMPPLVTFLRRPSETTCGVAAPWSVHPV